MHLDDERTQRFLHDQLSAEDVGEVQRHLASCALCRESVERARQEEEEVMGLLGSLDLPLPPLRIGDVRGKARRIPSTLLRWAAGIAGVLAASTVAYAAPGSPLPGWIDHLIGRLPYPPVPAVNPDRPSEPLPTGGIAVDPGTGLVVIIRSGQVSGILTVRLEEGDLLYVEASGGAPAFTSDEGRLLVENTASAGDILVRIPLSAARVEVRLGASTVFRKLGSQLTGAVEADDDGAYRIPLGGRSR